jgi:transcriptional regulator GlxA family with amidase domain
MKPRRVAFIGFDGVNALDLVGPAEAFASAFVEEGDRSRPGYAITILGLNRRLFRAESGVVFKPHQTLEGAGAIDTLIVPGGKGLRDPRTQARVVRWIRSRAPLIRRVGSVCTGIYGLAATGLLDGRRVTTHWKWSHLVAEAFPRLLMTKDLLYVKDGPFYTSAGVTAGIDLALAMIEEDYGSDVALRAAREMVVYLKRPGGQEQYSEPLRFQVESKDPMAVLEPWVRGHLRQDLSVETLARRASLSPRQFSRRFFRAFKQTPAHYVENLRLAEAQGRLTSTNSPIDAVAASVGFASADSFRRAFERRFSLAPTAYRRRFSGRTPNTRSRAS